MQIKQKSVFVRAQWQQQHFEKKQQQKQQRQHHQHQHQQQRNNSSDHLTNKRGITATATAAADCANSARAFARAGSFVGWCCAGASPRALCLRQQQPQQAWTKAAVQMYPSLRCCKRARDCANIRREVADRFGGWPCQRA